VSWSDSAGQASIGLYGSNDQEGKIGRTVCDSAIQIAFGVLEDGHEKWLQAISQRGFVGCGSCGETNRTIGHDIKTPIKLLFSLRSVRHASGE